MKACHRSLRLENLKGIGAQRLSVVKVVVSNFLGKYVDAIIISIIRQVWYR